MDWYPKNKLPLNKVRQFLIIFYLVGTIGFFIPITKFFFIAITPFAILLNTYLLFIYHQSLKFKDLLVFFSIYLLGYTIELVGVHTGQIFGNYSYGHALGVKLFETPFIIGFNWLFLTYTTTTVADYLTKNKWPTLFVAPALMVTYDIVLERIAPLIDMWYWEKSVVPLQNYIAWYIIAFGFVAILKAFKINTQNPLASIILICQFLFFVILSLLLR
ncbi:MAG: carotenoid biosynthesis protein [Bacteroidales bacterium]